MANVQKYGKSAIGHLAAHYERQKVKDPLTGKEEYVRFGNQEIDSSRTHLNYNLAPDRELGQVGFIRQRLSEVRCLKRDDVKVLCSWVVTLPKENEYGEKMEYTDDQIQDFFSEAYQQLRDRYGEENVISCYVHMDETTPHMHFAFIPVVEDKKRGDLKVSAKEVLTREDLQTFHIDLQRSMDERFGRGFFPILNGNTDGGNRTIMQLKSQRVAEEVSFAEQDLFWTEMKSRDAKESAGVAESRLEKTLEKLEDAESKLEEVTQDLDAATREKNYLEGRVNGLIREKNTLQADVELLKDEKEQAGKDKAELEKDLPELRERISEATDELRIMEAAIKRKKDEGDREFGRHDYFAVAIKKEREQEKKDQRMSLIEKFLELPLIKPLWEKFVLDQARGKTKVKSKDNNKGYGE